MLGLVQNAKANAVRASLNTDQMVLSHVQVCAPPLAFPRHFSCVALRAASSLRLLSLCRFPLLDFVHCLFGLVY
jgi:hypothetical protein